MVNVKDFDTPFKTIDRTTREKFSTYLEKLKDTINHQAPIKIHRTLHEKEQKTHSFQVLTKLITRYTISWAIK